jgi:hypothetical protein
MIFAAISLALAGIATVWSDILAKEESASAKSTIEEEQRRTEAEKAETKKYHSDTLTLLGSMKDQFYSLSPQVQHKVGETLSKLESYEAYKTAYPDLFKDAEAAATSKEFVAAVFDAIPKALGANILARISKSPDCTNIKIEVRDNDKAQVPIVIGTFQLDPPYSFIGYQVSANYVTIALKDREPEDVDISGGYNFVFSDDSMSAKVLCQPTLSKSDCTNNTDDQNTMKVFLSLQQKTVKSIKAASKSYSLMAGGAESLLKTFRCLSP